MGRGPKELAQLKSQRLNRVKPGTGKAQELTFVYIQTCVIILLCSVFS